MQKCPNFIMNIWFRIFCQIFAKLFAKNVKGGFGKYEILCADQLGRAEKKVPIAFLSNQPFMEQISSKYLLPSVSSNRYLAKFLLVGLQSTRTQIYRRKRKCISNILVWNKWTLRKWDLKLEFSYWQFPTEDAT